MNSMNYSNRTVLKLEITELAHVHFVTKEILQVQ